LRIGSRLIDGVAKKMSDDFFIKFNQTLSPAHAAVVAPAAGLTLQRPPIVRGRGSGSSRLEQWLRCSGFIR
jgi:hypothetical protein